MRRPLLQDLPSFLREDQPTQDLLQAFERLLLGGGDNLSGVLRPSANPPGLEDLLDDLPRYFTPGTDATDGTPDEFLPWLSQWVALSLRTDITYGDNKDPVRENELRRSFIADLVDIYRDRGTPKGMRRLLEVFTGRDVIVIDQVDDQPHFFEIRLNLEEIKGGSSVADFNRIKELAESVIRLEKPAHTRYVLTPIVVTMRIGQRAAPPPAPPGGKLPTNEFIRIGFTTRLGVVPRDPKSVWET